MFCSEASLRNILRDAGNVLRSKIDVVFKKHELPPSLFSLHLFSLLISIHNEHETFPQTTVCELFPEGSVSGLSYFKCSCLCT